MASTSSTATRQQKCDVFLSFRGADTRDGFVSHLYNALRRNQIETFIDNRLEVGEDIYPALLEKIEESDISVVIFSKNYADSPWCLEERDKILECKETLGQMVLPVFYKVDPTHVQELSDSYRDALAEHQRKSGPEKVKGWRRALTKIANLKGWDSNNIKNEAKLIEEIVHDIWSKLYAETSSNFHGLFGIGSRIKEVESLLCVGAPDVRIVGIWSMGDIGKTTLAEVIYNKISARFEGRFFLPNIRQELERSTTVALRNKILSEILGKDVMSIGTLNSLLMHIKRMLKRKKVLIVLDDVSSPQQLKALVGEDGLLGQGSRVLSNLRLLKFYDTVFEEMYHLRLLKFYYTDLFKENRILFPEGLEFLSNKPRVLHWDRCPLKSLPSNFHPENLVELRMRGSRLTNLSGFPHLEHLKLIDLRKCKNLVEVPPFVGYCSKLKSLELGQCGNLRCLPSFLHLTSLESLILAGCAKIEEFPEIPLNIQALNLSGTAIKQVPSSNVT